MHYPTANGQEPADKPSSTSPPFIRGTCLNPRAARSSRGPPADSDKSHGGHLARIIHIPSKRCGFSEGAIPDGLVSSICGTGLFVGKDEVKPPHSKGFTAVALTTMLSLPCRRFF